MRGIEAAKKELEIWDGYVADGREYLVGNAFTLVDIMVAVVIFFAQRAGATLVVYPHLLKYANSMRKRECFEDTWPPHWVGTENKDWLTKL
jgi:glutathione S-transferase